MAQVIDFGTTSDGDDIYTIVFTEAPDYRLPIVQDAEDQVIEAALAYVELVVGRPLARDPRTDFPLFKILALADPTTGLDEVVVADPASCFAGYQPPL